MKPEEVRAAFDKAISSTTDRKKKAQLAVVREYLTNPDFKAKLEEFVYGQTARGIVR